ncbi:MAG TPA: Hsp20/alpha crystallin family protein [Streptosporangiaceae bacterium]|nr:Hsp20/alpha crystallin family protein [Streptosporangiaceae bacterium]
MSTLTRKESRPFLDLFDWMDAPMTMFRPLLGQGMRMEDFVRDGHYIVRAELPGVDPDREVDVSVNEGILSIKAERHEEEVDKTHSEFRYGVFNRRIVLPAGADQDHIQASYDKGILEVIIDLKEKEAKQAEKHIPIKQTKAAKTS